MAAEQDYICIEKDQLQEQSKKIAELEAHSKFKEERITELIADNKRIESKIDNLTETVNKVMLNSIQDDNNLKQKVITLETKIDNQEEAFQQYKEDNQKKREDDRAKTNQLLTVITVGVTVVSFALNYLFK